MCVCPATVFTLGIILVYSICWPVLHIKILSDNNSSLGHVNVYISLCVKFLCIET